MLRRRRRNEQGSIAIAMVVILVTTGLIVTVAVLGETGLRSSRRAGDSANALQLADAGVNDAVKALTDYVGAPPPASGSLVVTGNLGNAGSYSATAVRESIDTWHIDAQGTDATGVRRRVRADALAVPLFSNAVFAQSTMDFHAGSSVDSYVNGLNQANTCTFKGQVGTNEPATTDLNVPGIGLGVRNCTTGLPGTPVAYDGCVGYANDEPVPLFLNEPASGVPSGCGTASKDTPRYDTFVPTPPTGTPQQPPLVCDGTTPPLPPGTYFYDSITLKNGCRMASTATSADPVNLYTVGPIQIGSGTGAINSRVVNQPSAPPSNCPDTAATGNDYLPGVSGSPLWYYCPNWAGKLRVWGAGGAGNSVVFGNGVKFWGTVYAPNYVIGGGSGSPQAQVWGALTGSSVATNAQFAVHYDEALANITIKGFFATRNWREEAIQ